MRNEDCKGKGGARASLANTVHVLSWVIGERNCIANTGVKQGSESKTE